MPTLFMNFPKVLCNNFKFLNSWLSNFYPDFVNFSLKLIQRKKSGLLHKEPFYRHDFNKLIVFRNYPNITEILRGHP